MGMIGDLTQLMFGISDRKKGKAFEAEAGERPTYEIPESVGKMISMYQQLAQGGMPGESTLKEDIQASTARTAGTASQLADSPVAALTALGGAQQRELGALRDLQVRAAQYQSQARQNYANAVGMRAGYEQEQWRQNQLLPWEIDMNRAMGLQTSGAGNIIQGANAFGDEMNQRGMMAAQMVMGMPPASGMGGQGGGQASGYVPPNYNNQPTNQQYDQYWRT